MEYRKGDEVVDYESSEDKLHTIYDGDDFFSNAEKTTKDSDSTQRKNDGVSFNGG